MVGRRRGYDRAGNGNRGMRCAWIRAEVTSMVLNPLPPLRCVRWQRAGKRRQIRKQIMQRARAACRERARPRERTWPGMRTRPCMRARAGNWERARRSNWAGDYPIERPRGGRRSPRPRMKRTLETGKAIVVGAAEQIACDLRALHVVLRSFGLSESVTHVAGIIIAIEKIRGLVLRGSAH